MAVQSMGERDSPRVLLLVTKRNHWRNFSVIENELINYYFTVDPLAFLVSLDIAGSQVASRRALHCCIS